jgi:hypothetical protein
LTIFSLFKSEKPLLAFSLGFSACATSSVVLAIPIFETYFSTGLVPRLPTALLCVALMLLGAILLACGIVLDSRYTRSNRGKALCLFGNSRSDQKNYRAAVSRRKLTSFAVVGGFGFLTDVGVLYLLNLLAVGSTSVEPYHFFAPYSLPGK